MSAVIGESIVDGPGLRYVVFVQGCPHRCPGCHNPGTHDPLGGYEASPDELISGFLAHASSDPLMGGVTISGGEPLAQARELLLFAARVREFGSNLWIYTGYTIEEIAERSDPDEIALAGCADALVDGRFVQSLRTLETPFKGSSNQRVIEDPARVLAGLVTLRSGR